MLSVGTVEQLERCESMLLWPGPGTAAEQIEALLAVDFHEIGASGRRFGRAAALEILLTRSSLTPPGSWLRSEVQWQEVAAGTVLASYRLQHDGKVSMRSTLWRKLSTGAWEAAFHQGTAVSGYSLSESSATA